MMIVMILKIIMMMIVMMIVMLIMMILKIIMMILVMIILLMILKIILMMILKMNMRTNLAGSPIVSSSRSSSSVMPNLQWDTDMTTVCSRNKSKKMSIWQDVTRQDDNTIHMKDLLPWTWPSPREDESW